MSAFVYIMTNAKHTVFYTGMTTNLTRRVHEHRIGQGSVFTKRYRVNKLVFYEAFDHPIEAIAAEKRIKAGSRGRKIGLLEEQNPSWKDLAGDIPSRELENAPNGHCEGA